MRRRPFGVALVLLLLDWMWSTVLQSHWGWLESGIVITVLREPQHPPAVRMFTLVGF